MTPGPHGSTERENDMVEDDKSATNEVLNLYGFALDARRWDLFDRVFSSHGHLLLAQEPHEKRSSCT